MRAIRAAEDKKAIDLVVLDLRKAAGFTDFFVICSGTNARQIRAIADGVMEALAADGAKPAHVEGYDRSEWILLDYFDFIVHVFAPETRLFYGLERLWGNADASRSRRRRDSRVRCDLGIIAHRSARSMAASQALRDAADSVLSVVLAPACAACEAPLDIPRAAPSARPAGVRSFR